MNFFKPTKVKVLGTLVVYLAGIVEGWLFTGLSFLLIPNIISTKNIQTTINLQKEIKQDISLLNSLVLWVLSFAVEIALLYLAVCFIVYLIEKQQTKSDSFTAS